MVMYFRAFGEANIFACSFFRFVALFYALTYNLRLYSLL